MEGKGRSGEKAEPLRPRDSGPGRRALRGPEAYKARACPGAPGCVCAPELQTLQARAALVKQVGKSVRPARARWAPRLQRWLPGAQARRAPRRRRRTCRTLRSTFLKEVRPPYVAQCLRGLPTARQSLSARVPSHSAAPARKGLQPGAPATRAAHAAPAGGLSASPPNRLTSSSAASLPPPRSFNLPFPFFFLFHPVLFPHLSPPNPASPPNLWLFLLPGFTERPYPVNPRAAKRVQYPEQGRMSCRRERDLE